MAQKACDLEFDTTVQNILNVHNVMTELPSPLEEQQKIHWRAVPSLKEIWEQERKRMSILLSPEKDFLSFDDKDGDDKESSGSSSSSDEDLDGFMPQESAIPQFTLNVKKGESVPGTILAVKGVKQLFRTSDGLEDDFRRALKDILLRHDKFLDESDQRIANGSMFQQQGSPSLEDGIEALAALGDQFTQNSIDSNGEEVAFGSQSSALTTVNTDLCDIKPIARDKYTMTQMTQEEIDEERVLLEFGASIDSDAIFDSYSTLNNINYSVLDPHAEDECIFHNDDDFHCEEDELGEEGFERALTCLSQAVEASNSNKTSVEYEEDLHEDMSHHYSQFCAVNIDENSSEDEVEADLKDDGSASLFIEEAPDEEASIIQARPTVHQSSQYMIKDLEPSSNECIDDVNDTIEYT